MKLSALLAVGCVAMSQMAMAFEPGSWGARMEEALERNPDNDSLRLYLDGWRLYQEYDIIREMMNTDNIVASVVRESIENKFFVPEETSLKILAKHESTIEYMKTVIESGYVDWSGAEIGYVNGVPNFLDLQQMIYLFSLNSMILRTNGQEDEAIEYALLPIRQGAILCKDAPSTLQYLIGLANISRGLEVLRLHMEAGLTKSSAMKISAVLEEAESALKYRPLIEKELNQRMDYTIRHIGTDALTEDMEKKLEGFRWMEDNSGHEAIAKQNGLIADVVEKRIIERQNGIDDMSESIMSIEAQQKHLKEIEDIIAYFANAPYERESGQHPHFASEPFMVWHYDTLSEIEKRSLTNLAWMRIMRAELAVEFRQWEEAEKIEDPFTGQPLKFFYDVPYSIGPDFMDNQTKTQYNFQNKNDRGDIFFNDMTYQISG